MRVYSDEGEVEDEMWTYDDLEPDNGIIGNCVGLVFEGH